MGSTSTLRVKNYKQLGASAVEYALALAVITTMVMAGAKLMTPQLEAAFSCAGEKIKALATGAEASCGGGGSGENPTPKTDEEKLQEILENYQVDESPTVLFTPEIVSVDFNQYSIKVTEAEAAILSQLSPLELLDFKEISESAFSTADSMFPKPEDWKYSETQWKNLGHNDAFRHTYWNALLTQRFGESWTNEYTTAHETVVGNEPYREAQDLYNNEVGRRIARENPNATETELQALVYDAVMNGDTIVVDSSGNLQYSDDVNVGEHKVKK